MNILYKNMSKSDIKLKGDHVSIGLLKLTVL